MEIDVSKIVFIEKELFNPDIFCNIKGPYYHIFYYNENGKKIILHTEKSGDIKEAARRAERELDFNTLAVAYAENPNSFKSITSNYEIKNAADLEFDLNEDDIEQIKKIINNAKERKKRSKKS